MCLDDGDPAGLALAARPGQRSGLGPEEIARVLAGLPELRRPHVGFVGYGATQPGDRVLIAVDSHYEAEVTDAIAAALRARGARVDVLRVEVGPDREFTDQDEIRVTIRNRPWAEQPRRWEGLPWVEELVEREQYALLIHGKGGPTPVTSYRYEQIPWLRSEHLQQRGTTFPQDVHNRINEKTWEKIWRLGRGGKVHLTDPEGTDLTFTLHEGYYAAERRGFSEQPVRSYGHLHGHSPPPILPEEDATGVLAATTSHFARPFPQMRLHFDSGRLEAVEGGGGYGDGWRELLAATRNNQYPCFPRSGLFWLWELAIGTNPKISRPSAIHLLSSGGFEWERRRSGVIHAGIGTRWRGPEEVWSGERGITYGHLHVHLLFPTYEIAAREGRTVKVIEQGRLTALDDPEVRALAARHGDPDDLLKEDWIPEVPGITAPGSYAEFAADPARWIYARPLKEET